MAKFYTLLERAVARLQPNTEGARQEIYARARSAVSQELRSIDPPLAPADRMRREQELEEAIRAVEYSQAAGVGAQAAAPAPTSVTTAISLHPGQNDDAERPGEMRTLPRLDGAEPRRPLLSRLLLVALLALVIGGASYAVYTYRSDLQATFASLTGGNEPAPSSAATADAGVGQDVMAPGPTTVAAVIPTQAFLYEAVGTGDAPAIEGVADWALVDDAEGTRIEVRIEIPTNGLRILLSMREAPDGATDVSHTMDVIVTTLAGDARSTPGSIGLLAAKTTEDAIGTAIVAESSTVAPGHLRLAFSAENERRNLQEMRRDWFDLGLVYANGERVLVTFSKGSQGHEVMQRALAAWGA